MKHLLLIFLSIFCCNYLFAQTWTGTTSTDWNTAANWSPNTVPTATSNVTIPGSLGNYPVLATDVTINSLNMARGSNLDFKGHILNITTTGSNNFFYGILNNSDLNSDIVINLNAGTDGNACYVRGVAVNDNITFNLSGTNAFNGADIGGNANNYAGNVTFNISSGLPFNLSNGSASQFNGDLTINRTITGGSSKLFNVGGNVKGNFKYNNILEGNIIIGNTSNSTTINGKVDIATNDNTTPGLFQLYRIINQTTGGTIDVQNSNVFALQNDTLKVNSLSITGYRGNDYAAVYNNDITGNLTLADDASYSDGHGTFIRSNVITGTSNFTSKGNNTFNEADLGGSGNHFIGDVSYTVRGGATLNLSNGDTSTYNGNLSISRPGAGNTQAFNSGGIISGNFSFTNNTAGNTTLGNNGQHISIGGMVEIAINNTTPGLFQLYRIINQTTGGTINVQNSNVFALQNDTLKVNSLSITGYRGNDFANFNNNDITGTLTLADDASYNGFSTNIRSNVITGDATFTHNSSNQFVDADLVNTGNYYTGNVTYNKNGSGNFSVGTGDTTSIGGSLTLNNAAIALNLIQFTGNNDGIVQQAGGTPITIPTLVMNKGGKAKITLMNPVMVTNNLNLNSGIIATGVNSNLVLPVNLNYLGGSDSSYVDGPMLKVGNNSFTFPVGQNNAYAPITITAPGNVTDQFRGQYIHTNPGNDGYDSTKKDPTLNHLSRLEYWLLDRTAGTSNVSVTLSWAPNRSGIVNDIPSLRVAHWNGTMWNDLGQGTTTGTNAMGTIQTAAVVTSFSPFTLASTTALNPLPISLLSFSAFRQSSSVFLNWSTENGINFSHFEVERSGSDNNFSSIGQVTAQNIATLQNYTLEDKQPLNGINLYRLKLIDIDGKFVWSNIVSVTLNSNGLITFMPNPASSFITISSPIMVKEIRLINAGGQLIKVWNSVAPNAQLYLGNIAKGIYMLQFINDNAIQTQKLMKE